MPGIGIPELLVLGLVVLIVFGPKRLPEMGRSLGRGLREFKSSVTGSKEEDELFTLPAELTVAEEVESPRRRNPEGRGQLAGSGRLRKGESATP